jgi:hypothetical protein
MNVEFGGSIRQICTTFCVKADNLRQNGQSRGERKGSSLQRKHDFSHVHETELWEIMQALFAKTVLYNVQYLQSTGLQDSISSSKENVGVEQPAVLCRPIIQANQGLFQGGLKLQFKLTVAAEG